MSSTAKSKRPATIHAVGPPEPPSDSAAAWSLDQAVATFSSSDQLPEITEPAVPKEEIEGVAASPDAEPLTRALAEGGFDSVNDGTDGREEIVELRKRQAAKERAENERCFAESQANPLVEVVRSSERIVPLNLLDRIMGFGAAGVLIVMAVMLPLSVILTMVESQSLLAVTDNPWLGVPFGVPAILAVLVGGMLRRTLSSAGRARYDAIIPVASLVALAGWAWIFSQTFVAKAGGPVGFGQGGSADLSLYYMAHVICEAIAALGMKAVVEKVFLSGLREVAIDSRAADRFRSQRDRIANRELTATRDWLEREEFAKRLTAAREAYVAKCLAYLHSVQERRRALLARAEAAAVCDVTVANDRAA